MDSIEKRIVAIEQRNKKVELNKAWETSRSRIIIIASLTYLTIVLFFYFAQLSKPFINSIVPAIGFVFSTLSLPFFKKLWLRHYVKSNSEISLRDATLDFNHSENITR